MALLGICPYLGVFQADFGPWWLNTATILRHIMPKIVTLLQPSSIKDYNDIDSCNVPKIVTLPKN
jgi:hypothetical protein